jgi:hypothetical protein
MLGFFGSLIFCYFRQFFRNYTRVGGDGGGGGGADVNLVGVDGGDGGGSI